MYDQVIAIQMKQLLQIQLEAAQTQGQILNLLNTLNTGLFICFVILLVYMSLILLWLIGFRKFVKITTIVIVCILGLCVAIPLCMIIFTILGTL